MVLKLQKNKTKEKIKQTKERKKKEKEQEKRKQSISGKVAHIDNSCNLENKAGRLRVWGQPGLHSMFQATLSH